MAVATATVTRSAMQREEVHKVAHLCDLGEGYLSLSPCTELCWLPGDAASGGSALHCALSRKRTGRIQVSAEGEIKNGRSKEGSGYERGAWANTFIGSDRLRRGRYETRVQVRGGPAVQTGSG